MSRAHSSLGAQATLVALACITLIPALAPGGATPPDIGGDPARGRAAMAELQCGACHVVPGIRAARGQVGPSLEGYTHRIYLAGKWANEPELLVRWLRDPPAMAPLTAMPALVHDEQTARDIAAYLYTLD